MDNVFDTKSIYKETKELLEYLQLTFKNRMKCRIYQDEKGFYTRIEAITDEEAVYNQINTSTSILVAATELKTENYEKKILKEIQKVQEEQLWISEIFYYISELPKREKHYLISYYFMNQKSVEIMEFLSVKKRTLNQIKSKAILHLGILVPGGIRINNL